MKTKDEIIKSLREVKGSLSTTFKVKSLALFGSYSRGDQTEMSDIDILVDIDPDVGLDFVTLAERLEEILGETVDLVSRKAVQSDYWELIEDELIYV